MGLSLGSDSKSYRLPVRNLFIKKVAHGDTLRVEAEHGGKRELGSKTGSRRGT